MTGIFNLLLGGKPSVSTDPYFNYTTLLLPGTGTNGAQNNTFLDSSSNTFTITRNGNTTQGTFSPFSQTGWGNYFDGTGDYLSVADNAVLRLGTNAFTIECWVYRSASGTAHSVAAKGGASTGWLLEITSGNLLQFTHGTTTIASTGTVSANTWVHVAAVREGTGSNQFKLYINGANDGTGTVSTDFTQTDTMYVAANRSAGSTMNGYVSNFRLTNGAALYTTAFTPATSELTTTSQGASSSQVELLTCQSNRFIDNSTNNFTITRNGDTRVVAFSPFAPTAAWSSTTNGGSGYFDGNGDYLTAPSNAAFAVGSVFTIEFWLYPISYGANPVFIFLGESTGDVQFGLNSGNLSLAASGVAWRLIGSKGPVTNAWNHCVLVRSGTGSNQTSIFLNGERIANGTVTDAWTTNVQAIIQSTSGTSYLTTGYMSGIRIVKGTAVYDPTQTSITVPTAPLTNITNTSLLLNFTNAGVYDATSKNDLETVGNAQISSTTAKWGSTSISFDGTGDWLLSTPSVINDFGTGNFTIEAWIYMTSTSNYFYIYNSSNANFNSPNFTFLYDTSLGLRMYAHSGIYTVNQGSTSGWVANTWYYVALVRNGGTITLYRNNTSLASGSTFSGVSFGSATAIPQIGGSSPDSRSNNGYIQDLRVSRYARDVTTTPTAAFPLL